MKSPAGQDATNTIKDYLFRNIHISLYSLLNLKFVVDFYTQYFFIVNHTNNLQKINIDVVTYDDILLFLLNYINSSYDYNDKEKSMVSSKLKLLI